MLYLAEKKNPTVLLYGTIPDGGAVCQDQSEPKLFDIHTTAEQRLFILVSKAAVKPSDINCQDLYCDWCNLSTASNTDLIPCGKHTDGVVTVIANDLLRFLNA